MIQAYIDGACKGNPGVGGWGVYLIDNSGKKYAFKGTEPETTNNRMEIMACLEALKYLNEKHPEVDVQFVTDSKYLKDAASVWIKTWYKNGWRTSNGMGVKNKDLWLQFLKLKGSRTISWSWVRGHSGVEGNEMADKLANQAIDSLRD
jgi:ribonuclease HI